MSFIARIPGVFQDLSKHLTWRIDNGLPRVYLTFDDGPTPEVTPWVLDQLDQFNARATFFCLGKNVEAHKDIYDEILRRGHRTGNHSFSHVKGFKSNKATYCDDVQHAAKIIESRFYRPPYGRILPSQIKEIRKDFDIIMWSVLSVDYNRKISGDHVVRNVTSNVKPGSIVVFHDSVKASRNLYYALPRVLEFLTEKGYEMCSIELPS